MKEKVSKLSLIIHRKTIENQGYSVNTSGLEPVKGYMVGLRGTEIQVNILDFNAMHVEHFIRKNLSALFNPDCYIGTWINGTTVFIDLSLNIQNKNCALRYSDHNGQICIWDVLNKVEIYQLQEETV